MNVAPEVLASTATDLAKIGTAISAASASAASPTVAVLPAAADEVSAAISAVFGQHAGDFQHLSRQLVAWQDRCAGTLSAAADSYAQAELANIEQLLLNAVNAPTQALLGRP
nr:PE family protein [Mycobacterium gordonae]